MRRLIPFLALAIALTACGGSDNNAAPSTTTSTAAPTSTTEPAPTTTVEPATTSPETSAPTTTQTPGNDAAAAFAVLPATPPAVFDSFTASLVISMGFDDTAIEVDSQGIWTGDAFECTMTMGLGGLGLSQAVIATPETLWLDSGAGFEESSLFGPAQDVLAGCPASPLFWGDFAADELGRAVGDTEEFAGRTAIKLDLTELLDFAGGVGVIPDLEDADINSMVMWIDEATNVVLGLYADLEIDPAALGELGMPGSEPAEAVAMIMDLRVDRIDDPSISIELPTDS